MSPPEQRTPRSTTLLAALLFLVIFAAATTGLLLTREKVVPERAVVTVPQIRMSRLTKRGDVTAAAISGDGRSLVYATGIEARQTLWLRQIATGTDVEIAPPDEIRYDRIQISPDGESVFYTATTTQDRNVYDIWQRPLTGGPARRIAHDTEGRLAVAPDGKSVAFRRYDVSSRRSSLVVTDLTAGRERTLLVRILPDGIGEVAWRGSDRLVFTGIERTPRFRTVLMQIHLRGGRVERLTAHDWFRIHSLQVLADSSGAIVCADEPMQPPRILYVPFDGGAQRRITTDISFYGDVTVTADGKSVVAVRDNTSANLYVRPLDAAGAMRPVTAGQNLHGYLGVRWLPDGGLVFTAFEGDQTDLYTVNAAGGDLRRLTRAYGAVWPAVSAAAGRIAFLSLRSGTTEVWTCDLNGTNVAQVTRQGPVADADFFPDGRAIAWSTVGEEYAIWASDVDGTHPRRIVSRPARRVAIAPDGKTALARVRGLQGEQPLWQTALVSVGDGQVLQRLDAPRVLPTPQLVWLPDGAAFAYVDGGGRGGANIWVRDLQGGEPRQVTEFPEGVIYSFDVDARRELVVAHGTPLRDAVLIRDFR